MKTTIEKAIAGDKNAFIRFLGQVKVDIYRTAFSYMKTEDAALEVVQEVTYRAWRKIHSLREPAYAKTWIIRITINYCNDLLRERKKLVQMDDLSALHTYEENFHQLEITYLLEKLSDEEREWIMLKYIHGRSFQELANIYHINENMMKTRIYKVLGKLRHEARKGED